MWVETLGSINSPDLPAVLAVVVHEHVLADAKEGGGVHVEATGDRHLEPSHVARVAGIF